MPSNRSKATPEQAATEAVLDIVHLAVPEADTHELTKSILDHLRDWSGCEAAGLRLRDGHDFPYYEVHGFPAEFVELERSLCAHAPDGGLLLDANGDPELDCMCGQVIRGEIDTEKPFFTAKGSFWTNSTTDFMASITEADIPSRARGRCVGEGYESVALIPLRAGGQTVGLIQLDDKRRDRFTPQMIAQAEQMAASIALVLSENQARQALEIQNEKYRALFEESMDGVLLCRPDGAILEANPTACALLGMTEKEIVAAGREGIVVATPSLFEDLTKRDRTGRAQGELTFAHKDGTQFPVEFTSVVLAETGGARRSFVVFRDITERKKAEKSLRESEERFRRIVTHTNAGYFLIDREGNFVQVNDAWLAMHGFERAEEVVGRHFSLTQVDSDMPQAALIVKTALSGGHVHDSEFSHRCRDGSVGYHTFTLSPVMENEEIVGLEGFLIDTTESRKTEHALRDSEARQRDVLAHGGVGVAYFDLDGHFLFLNDKALQNLGSESPGDLLGRSLHEVFGQEVGDPYLARIRDAAASPESIMYEDCVELPFGKRWLWSAHTRSLDDEGSVVGVHVYSTDITALKETEESLRQSERDLIEAQRLARVSSYTYDPVSKQYAWSQENYRIWGLPPERPPKPTDLRQMLAEEDSDQLDNAVQEVIDNGTPFEIELRVRRPDGTERYLIATGRPEFNAAGDIVLVKGTHQDVTERRRIEEDLRTLFREMLDGFALHEIECDPEGKPVDYRFVEVNPAFERMTGTAADQVVGRKVSEAFPGTEQHWIDTYGRVALTGEPAVFENYHAVLGKHFLVTAFRPAPNQFACLFSDITDRKKAEEALRGSEAKLRGILDNLQMGVALISPQMEILDANPMMREWFPGIDMEQRPLCYRSFNVPLRDEPCDDCPVRLTMQDGLVHEAIRERPTKENVRASRVLSSPVFDEAGNVTAVIELVEDVTERVTLELQLQQAQKMESVGRLAGGVAHDFNNMLGVILGHTEMALGQTEPRGQLYTDLQEIRKAAERSADLTRQLLAFARKQTVAPKILDMNEVVTGMLSMLERLIGEDIELDWRPGADLWPVKVDPSQVAQVLTNLCVNARDAIAGVGRVTISTSNITLDPAFCAAHVGAKPGDCVQLAVTDDGCGMDKETIARLFEPFFTTKSVGEGTGLGLATVYGIVKQNGGLIMVDSKPGKGSTFTICMPRHSAAIEPEEEHDLRPSEVRGQETVLVVEDEPALLMLAKQMLELQGYTVMAARTPGEAIHLAREHPGDIHLLLTDVVMPEMNGRDLAKNLLSLYPRIRRLFMSGYTSDVIAHQGVLEEGVHFLQKPFSYTDLTAKVRQALNSEG